VVLVLLLAVVASATAALRSGSAGRRWRHGPVAAAGLLALAELVAVGAHQLHSIGRLEYYWWKLAAATAVVGTVLLAHQLATTRLPARLSALAGLTHGRRAPAAWCAVVAFLGLGVADLDLPAPTVAPLASLPAALRDPARVPQAQRLVVAAGRVPCGGHSFTTLVLLPTTFDRSGLNADQWFHALHHSRSREVARRALLLNDLHDRPDELARQLAARGWSLWHPGDGAAPAGAAPACLTGPGAAQVPSPS
jgi:hypothetical protein